MRPCPTCLPPNRSFARVPSIINLKRPVTRRTQQQSPCLAKSFVTSTTSASLHRSPSGVEPLTILYKATALLPRVPCFEEGSGPQQTKRSDLWEPILSGAHEDLSATADRPVKIVGLYLSLAPYSQFLSNALVSMQ